MVLEQTDIPTTLDSNQMCEDAKFDEKDKAGSRMASQMETKSASTIYVRCYAVLNISPTMVDHYWS